MCGIAGLVGGDVDDFGTTRREQILGLLLHRGPDDHGVFVSESGVAQLLHRRLSIIDLSPAGHQPMTDPDRGTVIVFNGEIYNYRELDEELRALGYKYRSASDTETILHAYAEWGEGCLQRLNGMFAFALWDERHQTLFCARDRFGEKPLYYHLSPNGRFVFASEIKALFAFPDVPRAANLTAIQALISSDPTDTGDATFFAGIRTLPPATALRWEAGRISTRRYWSLAPGPTQALSSDQWTEALRDGLRRSIRLRLRSDVPVGTCLSGGLDSSAIVTMACETRNAPVSCFSIVYDDPELSERPYVEAMGRQPGVELHVAQPDGKDFHETLRRIVWHNDQPSSGFGQYSQWHAMKLAAERGVVVLLNGQGGDEIFAGYDRYVATGVRELLLKGRLRAASRLARSFARLRQVPSTVYWRQALYPSVPPIVRRTWMQRPGRFLPNQLAGPALPMTGPPPVPLTFDSIRSHLIADLTVSSVPALVHAEDRCSMAFSREIRLPFLDHNLVELVLDAPSSLKIDNGETKVLLRRAMKGHLNETVRLRADKKGYPTPVSRWLRTSAADEALAVIRSPEFARRGFLDPRRVEALLADHKAGRGDHGLLIWRCLSVEYWARAFLDSAPVSR